MSKYDQSAVAAPFDSAGDGYDYQTAIDSGGSADDLGHWQSLDPRTGQVLKGRNHPTWDKTVEEETKLGNTIIKSDDGRYYSTKTKYATSQPVSLDDNKDTPVNFAERAKRDYDFSIENNVTFDFGDSVRREWATPAGLQKKIPFVGGLYSISENLEMIATADRLKNNSYEQAYFEVLGRMGPVTPEEKETELGTKEQFIQRRRQQDKDEISAHLKYVTADKTTMAKIAAGVSILPTWFVEFAATGGLASLGDDIARKAGEKILGQYAKTTTGKIALRTAGWGLGATYRSAGLSHRIVEGATQRQLDALLGLREDEGWATSALMSWGDVVIESASEALFGGVGSLVPEGQIAKGLAKLPFAGKMVPALQKSWMKVTGGTKAQFAKKMLSKGGYSNIIGEIGEERLGTILRAITGVDDFGAGPEANMLERLKFGIVQDWENKWVELGVLAVPAAGQVALGVVDKFGRPKEVFTDEFDQEIQEEPDPSVEQAEDISELTGKPVKPVGEDIGPITDKPVVPFEGVLEAAAEAGKTAPVEIKDANTKQEVRTVANKLMTNKDTITSARQAEIQKDMEALGLDEIASTGRRGWQEALQKANDENIPDNALRIASEINSKPRPLDDIQTAGLVIKGARLKNEHNSIMQRISETEDAADLASLTAELDRVEGEFESLNTALVKSGSEKGRALAAQKLTINQDFDLISLKNRAKARKGKPLTEKETKKIEQLSKDLRLQVATNKRLLERVDKLIAEKSVKRGSVTRYSRMARQDVNLELDSLISRTRQLLDEGCYN